jgi:hypothetical protein
MMLMEPSSWLAFRMHSFGAACGARQAAMQPPSGSAAAASSRQAGPASDQLENAVIWGQGHLDARREEPAAARLRYFNQQER